MPIGPGRAAYVRVDRDWDSEQWEARVVEVCTDYTAHGHAAPSDEWHHHQRQQETGRGDER